MRLSTYKHVHIDAFDRIVALIRDSDEQSSAILASFDDVERLLHGDDAIYAYRLPLNVPHGVPQIYRDRINGNNNWLHVSIHITHLYTSWNRYRCISVKIEIPRKSNQISTECYLEDNDVICNEIIVYACQ